MTELELTVDDTSTDEGPPEAIEQLADYARNRLAEHNLPREGVSVGFQSRGHPCKDVRGTWLLRVDIDLAGARYGWDLAVSEELTEESHLDGEHEMMIDRNVDQLCLAIARNDPEAWCEARAV